MHFLSTLAVAVALSGSLVAQLQFDTFPQPWASNNGGSVGGGIYFDVTLTAGIRITQFDCNFSSGAGTAGSIDVYTINGTHAGNENTQASWTLVGSAPCTAAGRELPTVCVFTTPFILNPGTYGIAICANGLSHAYTNGTGTNQTFSDPFITSTHGTALNVCFGTGAPFNPRVWNGSIHYTPAQGQFPSFTGDVTSGPAPLTVNFTDQSFTSDPAGIIAWLWDIDNDGTVDYQTQNITHTYTQGGVYDVSLQIIDAQFGLSPPFVRTAYVNVTPTLGTYVFHRAGCAGSTGSVTTNVAVAGSVPQINSTFSVRLSPLPASNTAIMVFGIDDTVWNGSPLPFDGAPFGAAGCFLNIAPEATTLVLGASGSGTWNLPIPNNNAFVGTQFFTQALVLDPGHNGLGGVASDSAVGVVQ